jgi:glycosyl transferase family 25
MISILESSGPNIGKISFNADSALLQRTKDGRFYCYNDQMFWSSGMMKKDMFLGNYRTISLPGQHIEYRADFNPGCDSISTGTFTGKIKYKTFVINLDRRQDRMKKVEDQKLFLPQFERISAVDGQQLKISKRLRSLCRHGNYRMRAGVIGCALSHLKLFLKLLNDDENDGYVIIEDDIVVDESFLEKFHKVFDIFESRNTLPPLLFFTTTYNRNYIEQCNSEIIKKKFNEMHFTIGGSGCYFISKDAAKKAVEWIEKNTLSIEIDNILFRLGNELDVYFVLPRICLSPECDTDIQNDFFIKSQLFEENLKEEDYSPNILYNDHGDIDLFDEI